MTDPILNVIEQERETDDNRRRQRILNWLTCALKEAGEKVEAIDLMEDGVCEWVNVQVSRGIFKINVTGESDIQMMIDILTYLRGR